MRQTQIFSGSSHPALVEGICDRLGMRPGDVELGEFANGETKVNIQTSIRNHDVFIVQSGSQKVNDAVVELLIMASACKGSSARSITAVLPYFPYSRQSKKKSHRGAITARMLANLLHVAGVNHVITLDLHANQMQGFFKCPVDNLAAEPLLARWIKHHIPDWQEAVVVSKNAGGSKRVTSLADALKLSFGIITTDQRRYTYGAEGSVDGSVIFERFGLDGNADVPSKAEPEARLVEEAVLPPVQEEGNADPKAEERLDEKQAGHNRKSSSGRSRAPSNPLLRRMYSDVPPSPLGKSIVRARDRTPSPVRLSRISTAPDAPASHDDANGEEFLDERARDVIQGRFVHGHIVDEGIPSPSMSAVSSATWRSRYNAHQRNSSSDDDDPPPQMLASFMSVASSVRRDREVGDGLGGSMDAGASSEEEEEDLKNPELETTITLVGNVRGRPVFIVDDMIDKSGSWIAAAECCVKRGGATKVYCMATHGLFGDGTLEELEECECIEKVIVTNSFPLEPEKQATSSKLVQLDVSGLLAEAIRRNHHGENISQLYMHYND